MVEQQLQAKLRGSSKRQSINSLPVPEFKEMMMKKCLSITEAIIKKCKETRKYL
jgi:hypothetical protein